MAREAFLPLFYGDFLASTAEWEGEAASLYLTMLGHQWTLGSLPVEAAKLQRLSRWEKRLFERHWPQVAEKFEERDGRLYNVRLEQHREKATALAEKNAAAGRKGAATRWRKDSERHSGAIEAPLAERQPETDGATHSNPSHPIPSHISPPSGERASSDASPPRVNGFHVKPEGPAKAPKPKRRGPLGHFVPADFEVPDADADWAKAEFPALDLYAATQKFREHEFAQPKSDWRLTWRRWIRTEAEMHRRTAANGRR